MRVGPNSSESVLARDRKGQGHREGGNVTMGAEMGVMCL